MHHYMLSLAIADLVCGVVLVPLCVYPSLTHQWVYGDTMCRICGYLTATLWTVSVYTCMWIGVDRYIAVRKPVRYDVVQTQTRCQCWVFFTWVMGAALCCPPILGVTRPYFEKEVFICMMDWSGMPAYSITVGTLILIPSVLTIMYTYGYIFYTMRSINKCIPQGDKEYASALTENLAHPNHAMSFVIVATFWLSWLPWLGIRIYQSIFVHGTTIPYLQFTLFWLGVLNCFWKFPIYVSMSPRFRSGLKSFCLSLCCIRKGRPPDIYVTWELAQCCSYLGIFRRRKWHSLEDQPGESVALDQTPGAMEEHSVITVIEEDDCWVTGESAVPLTGLPDHLLTMRNTNVVTHDFI